MTRLLPQFRLFALLLWAAWGTLAEPASARQHLDLISQTASEVRFTITIDSSSVRRHSTSLGLQLHIDGFATDGLPGEIPLPRRGFAIAIPPAAQPQLDFRVLDEIELATPDLTPMPAYVDGQLLPAATELPAPVATVRLVEVVQARTHAFAVVELSPARLLAGGRAIRLARKVEVTLHFGAMKASWFSGATTSLAVATRDTVLLRHFVNPDQAVQWGARLPDPALRQPLTFAASDGVRARIVVDAPAWYGITGRMLRDAGVDFSGEPPASLQVSYRGTPVPSLVLDGDDGRFDDDDQIVFFGDINRGDKSYYSPYTEENVYLISAGAMPALRLTTFDGTPPPDAAAPEVLKEVVHYEVDLVFDRLLDISDEQIDHWFWLIVTAGGRDASRDVPFRLPQPPLPDGEASMRIAFRGRTKIAALAPDHSVVALLNGTPIGAGMWDGSQEFVLETAPFAASLLANGLNTLTLQAPGDSPAGDIDSFFLNWFELRYPRAAMAVQNRLHITPGNASGPATFAAGGFTTDELFIFDRNGRRFSNVAIGQEGNGYRVRFHDPLAHAANGYDLLATRQFQPPVRLERAAPTAWRSPANGADYIVITPALFRDGIEPLVAHRRREGLRVTVVDVQEIYDEFAGGNFDPRAIRAFLTYAYANWQPPAPRYVLLVGDTQEGFRKRTKRNRGESFVPSYMAYTLAWGVTSSDNYFVQVAGSDVVPDLAIGRFPCNDEDELRAMVEKTIEYETQPIRGRWRSEINLSAGDIDFFERQAETLNDHFVPKKVKVNRLYARGGSRYTGGTEEMLQIFNYGNAVINFMGHGAGGVFSNAGLFELKDAMQVRNKGRWPILLAWSCFIGYFDNPETPSLGEVLVRLPEHGAIASFGSAGRAWLIGDSFFNEIFFDILFKSGEVRLGEITRLAKTVLYARYPSYKDMVLNYNLLGDPALIVPLPQHEMSIEVQQPAVASDRRLQLQGNVGRPVNGSVLLEASVKDDSLVGSSALPVRNGAFAGELTLPTAVSGAGTIRSYFVAGDYEANGAAFFAIDHPFLDDAGTEPAAPRHMQPFVFWLRPVVIPEARIDSVAVSYGTAAAALNRQQRLQRQPDGRYTAGQSVQEPGGRIVYYQFRLYQTRAGSVEVVETELLQAVIAAQADLAFLSSGLALSGSDPGRLHVSIRNLGGESTGAFRVGLYRGFEQGQLRQPVAFAGVPGIAAGDTVTVTLDWPGIAAGRQAFTLFIDPDSAIGERRKSNNMLQAALAIATVAHGSGGQIWSNDSVAAVTIAPGGVQQNRFLLLQPWQPFFLAAGADLPSGLSLVEMKNEEQIFYRLSALNDVLPLTSAFALRLHYNAADSNLQRARQEQSLRLLFWDELRNEYQVLPLLSDENGMAQAQVPGAGAVTLVRLLDRDGPQIHIAVAGKRLRSGDRVAQGPAFAITVFDDGGVASLPRGVTLRLNGETPDSAIVTFNHQREDGMVLINYAPELPPGAHELSVIALDRNGNRTEEHISFEVAEGLGVLALANHPNPFQQQTIIAYTLQAPTSEVALRIYTVAGRKIREFNFFNQSGYVEQVWDGTDENGNEMPNGVYYLQFIARQGEQVVERIEKMARLR